MHQTKTVLVVASREKMEEDLLVASLSGLSLEVTVAKYLCTVDTLSLVLDLRHHIDPS